MSLMFMDDLSEYFGNKIGNKFLLTFDPKV